MPKLLSRARCTIVHSAKAEYIFSTGNLIGSQGALSLTSGQVVPKRWHHGIELRHGHGANASLNRIHVNACRADLSGFADRGT